MVRGVFTDDYIRLGLHEEAKITKRDSIEYRSIVTYRSSFLSRYQTLELPARNLQHEPLYHKPCSGNASLQGIRESEVVFLPFEFVKRIRNQIVFRAVSR